MSIARGVAWAVACSIVFAISLAAAKGLAVRLPPAELAWIRALAALVFVGGIVTGARQWRRLALPGWYAVRIGAGVVGMLAFMYAVGVIPIATATLIMYSRILMIPAVARVLLGEAIHPRAAVAGILAVAGALVALWPAVTLQGQYLAAAAVLLAAVSTAISQTAVRRLVQGQPPELTVAMFGLGASIVLAPLAMSNWVPPPMTADGLGLALLLGATAAAAQYAAARAYSHAPAGVIAPLDALAVPVAAVSGWLIWREVPTTYELVGAGLILAATWCVATIDRPAVSPAVTPAATSGR